MSREDANPQESPETAPAEQEMEESSSRRNAAWTGKRSPVHGRCPRCGSSDLSHLPTFSIGSGIAARPVADDVYCRRCGHIAPPDY